MLMSLVPACSASMNAFVPERAMVPRLLIRSAFVIPIPVSRIVSVLFVLSAVISITRSGFDSSAAGLVSD